MKTRFIPLITVFTFLFLVTSCKQEDGKDGIDGKSYFTVTWSSDPDIFFMGGDTTGDIPLPYKGEDRVRDVSADDGNGESQHTVYFYSTDYDKTDIKDLDFEISPGQYVVGKTDATWDADVTPGTTNPKYQYKFITISPNNVGEKGTEASEYETGKDGADGEDNYYSFDAYTGTLTKK